MYYSTVAEKMQSFNRTILCAAETQDNKKESPFARYLRVLFLSRSFMEQPPLHYLAVENSKTLHPVLKRA